MYSSYFKYAVEETLDKEGFFSDDKKDPGGRTKYGITEKTWRHFRADYKRRAPAYPVDVAKITREHAVEVYWYEFWKAPKIDRIPDKYVAAEVFDTAVNCGPRNGCEMFQQALNYCRYEAWEKLKIDGDIGPKTQAFCSRLLERGNRLPILEACNGEQYIWYKRLDRPHTSRGWTRRLAIAKELS